MCNKSNIAILYVIVTMSSTSLWKKMYHVINKVKTVVVNVPSIEFKQLLNFV